MTQLTILDRTQSLIRSAILSAIKPKVPPNISKNFIDLDEKALHLITQSLKEHYFSQAENRFEATLDEYLTSDKGSKDFQDHLVRRTELDRRSVIPWLHHARPLSGANILEIGCGTGCSTVALAEQGANVTGVDVNKNSISVAKARCVAYNLNVDFLCVNACELHETFANHHFDFIIFFAALEHMTHEERMIAMKSTWEMLAKGGLWVVIETPNRLWHFDGHTSWLPFYSWLHDQLAFEYSRFSPREGFNTSYKYLSDETMLDFLRRGRGVSYHEFDLTLKDVKHLKVISSLDLFLRNQNFLRKTLRRFTLNHRYENILMKVGPKIHKGFYQPNLNLIIEKN